MIKQNLRIKNVLLAGFFVGLISASSLAQNALASEPEKITVTYPYYAFVEDPDHPWSSVYDALDATGEIQ